MKHLKTNIKKIDLIKILNLIKKNTYSLSAQHLLNKKVDPLIEQINAHIQTNVGDINYAVNHLADSLNLTSTQLNRRLKKIVFSLISFIG